MFRKLIVRSVAAGVLAVAVLVPTAAGAASSRDGAALSSHSMKTREFQCNELVEDCTPFDGACEADQTHKADELFGIHTCWNDDLTKVDVNVDPYTPPNPND